MVEANPDAATRHRQEKVGIVTSAKMQKTIVVEVRRRVAHPVYKRIVTKRWMLKEVIRAATIAAPVE
jgi:ribosomal protein S17